MSSAAKIAANQRNAQLSTGPTSETGRSKSALNAVKTGLTGHTVLLPGDDAAAYEAHVAQFLKRYEPSGDVESNLVYSLANTEWRLLRIFPLEMGIYAVGRLEFAELFANEDAAVRSQLIEAKIFLSYQRQLNNLSIQEGRLRRQGEKDTAALNELQNTRKQRATMRLNEAAALYIWAVRRRTQAQFDPAELGFEFSVEEIDLRARDINPRLFAESDQRLREEDEKAA